MKYSHSHSLIYNKSNKSAEKLPVFNGRIGATGWLRSGTKKHRHHRLPAAIYDYSQAIRLDPASVAAWYNRALAYDSLGQWVAALRDYTESLRLDPDDADAYYNRGRVLRRQGDIDGAIADYTTTLRIDPTYRSAYNSLGAAYHGRKNFIAAIDYYTQAIEVDDTYGLAYSNRGEAYFTQGDYDRALADFEKAHELSPEKESVIGGLAITHHALRHLEQATDYWEELVEMDDQYEDADWAALAFNWGDPLIEAARKVVSLLL